MRVFIIEEKFTIMKKSIVIYLLSLQNIFFLSFELDRNDSYSYISSDAIENNQT